MGVTKYEGFEKIYFQSILKCCSRLGKFSEFSNKNLLDFGCGTKELKKFAFQMNYYGYDLDPLLTEIRNWHKINFHTVVINHTLMYLTENEICELFENMNNAVDLEQIIVGVGRQNILSKIGKRIFSNQDAHDGTLTSPRDQIKLIKKYFNVVRVRKVFLMTDVILLTPRKEIQ